MASCLEWRNECELKEILEIVTTLNCGSITFSYSCILFAEGVGSNDSVGIEVARFLC